MMADKLGHGKSIDYQGNAVDISAPWPRIPVREVFIKSAGWDPVAHYEAGRFDHDMATLVLPGLETGRPTVLTEYPASAASLARFKPGAPGVAERAEVFIGGLELANAYSELTDPGEQRKRFTLEISQIEREQGRKMKMPESFIDAMGSIPRCGGIAAGALTGARRGRAGLDPVAARELKRSFAGLENRLAAQESAGAARLASIATHSST